MRRYYQRQICTMRSGNKQILSRIRCCFQTNRSSASKLLEFPVCMPLLAHTAKILSSQAAKVWIGAWSCCDRVKFVFQQQVLRSNKKIMLQFRVTNDKRQLAKLWALRVHSMEYEEIILLLSKVKKENNCWQRVMAVIRANKDDEAAELSFAVVSKVQYLLHLLKRQMCMTVPGALIEIA